MKEKAKALVRRILPQSSIETLRYVLQDLPHTRERLATQRGFVQAPTEPGFLDGRWLSQMQRRYPPPADYRYDPSSLEARGKERASQLLRFSSVRRASSFLEIGCWDGMVSLALHQRGKNTTAIDARDDGFDERALRGGVAFAKMDAATLGFADESFDCVFSYDALEHVSDPARVIGEAIRVLRPGGHLYLEFGPLYYSAFGEHAYRSVNVPYCQCLFTTEAIASFVDASGLQPIDFNHVNRWPLERYRWLWREQSKVLKPIYYREGRNLAHLDLIRQYPSCFKSKSTNFDNFLVSSITALFQKQ